MNQNTAQKPIETSPSLHWLREQIAAKEGRRIEEAALIPTGWASVDQAIGGLRCGATHEWFTPTPHSKGICGSWTPPLLVLTYLSLQALRALPEAWVVCIGRRVWPSVLRLACSLPRIGLNRWLMIDASDARERIWAIDAALRCERLVVIADGSGLDTAATRRLQLAAEAGGSLGLIARPSNERSRISIAETRWEVLPAASPNERARWKLCALRIRGGTAPCPQVLVECGHDGTVVCVSDQVGCRPGAAATSNQPDAGDRACAG